MKNGHEPASYTEHLVMYATRHERRLKALERSRRRRDILKVLVVAFWVALFVVAIVGLFVPPWK